MVMVLPNSFALEIQAHMICSVVPLRYSRNKFHTHRRDAEKGKFWGERGDGKMIKYFLFVFLFVY
jgi:hypothetical protein